MRQLILGFSIYALSSDHVAYAADRGSGVIADGTILALQERLGLLRRSVTEIAGSIPDLPGAIGRAFLALVGSGNGQSPMALAITVTAILLAAVAAVHIARLLLADVRAEFVGPADGKPGPAAGLAAVGLDLAERAAAAIVAGVAAEILLGSPDSQSRFGFAVVIAGVLWWTVMLLAEILLRPRAPQLRLVSIDDRAALFAWRAAGAVAVVLLAINKLLPLLIDSGLSVPHAQVAVLATGTSIVAFVGSSLGRMGIAGPAGPPAVRLGLAAFWLVLVVGVLRVDLSIVDSLILTVLVVALAFAVDRLIGLGSGAGSDGRLQQVVRRCSRVAATAIVLSLLAETWLVGQFELFSDAQWHEASRASFTSIVVLFAGYIAWEALRHWIDRNVAGATPVIGPGGDGGEIMAASRFTTLLPLFRTFGAIAIFILTLLVALSEWGVNIVPLLAGASIFGLAISFGSQALVRDIVSGIFFIADDAFRVGEYVDTGRLKGTVEAITVRSVKLRHQSGQVHTIPFGQLQFVTNFSRDWSTVKFNLRLARDSDIEKIRKTIKRIGAEMKEDAELGPEMIEPLKLQGVADIVDNALVVRLKFTVRPVKPSWVQREALKRIHSRFREVGIEFASNAVTVQTADMAVGGAAAAARPMAPTNE